jgi:hypothetical protein
VDIFVGDDIIKRRTDDDAISAYLFCLAPTGSLEHCMKVEFRRVEEERGSMEDGEGHASAHYGDVDLLRHDEMIFGSSDDDLEVAP